MQTIDEMLKNDLTDKVALITGGAQRVGAMTARLLHAAGANLILHYRHSRQSALELQTELNDKRNNSVILIQAELLKVLYLKVLSNGGVWIY
jgi:pteridine reductase